MMVDEIREILKKYADLAVDAEDLELQDDLYSAGMTSQAGVNVMLALEERFDVEFPDRMLSRASFSSIGSIQMALAALGRRP